MLLGDNVAKVGGVQGGVNGFHRRSTLGEITTTRKWIRHAMRDEGQTLTYVNENYDRQLAFLDRQPPHTSDSHPGSQAIFIFPTTR